MPCDNSTGEEVRGPRGWAPPRLRTSGPGGTKHMRASGSHWFAPESGAVPGEERADPRRAAGGATGGPGVSRGGSGGSSAGRGGVRGPRPARPRVRRAEGTPCRAGKGRSEGGVTGRAATARDVLRSGGGGQGPAPARRLALAGESPAFAGGGTTDTGRRTYQVSCEFIATTSGIDEYWRVAHPSHPAPPPAGTGGWGAVPVFGVIAAEWLREQRRPEPVAQ